MKRSLRGATLLGALVAFTIAVILLVRTATRGGVHEFILQAPPAFLTDKLALSKAIDALKMESGSANVWKPHADNRSTAPDGTRDEYLARNALDVNRGVIQFVALTGTDVRFVTVEMQGDRVRCTVTKGR